MLELRGVFGIKMRNLSFSLFALVALLWSCEKEVQGPKDQEILVLSASTGQPLPSIAIHLNGQFQAYTNEQGSVFAAELSPGDTLVPAEAGFQYTRVREIETEDQINTVYWASKNGSEKDSLGVALLLDMQNAFGLLPTIPYGNLVSTYDQALAAIAFTLAGETQSAERIFDFFNDRRLSELESGPGGFYQFRAIDGSPSGRRWMGDNAWLLIALKNYVSATGSDKYEALISSLEFWLIGLSDTANGGLWGGFEANGDTIHKITEGNIDAFAALDGFTAVHRGILTHLQAEKWDAMEGNFVAWPTNPPYKFALDCNTWGYCAFPNFDDAARSAISKYALTVASTATSAQISGYCFDEDKDALWYEGTGQVAVMHWVAGDRQSAQQVLGELDKGWVLGPAGAGLPYTANQGTAYGADPLWSTADTEPCVSSTAWYLMASFRHNPLFLGRTKNVPVADQFWAQ